MRVNAAMIADFVQKREFWFKSRLGKTFCSGQCTLVNVLAWVVVFSQQREKGQSARKHPQKG